MQHSATMAKAAAAFVAAQAQFRHAKLTAVNPHFKSKYAPFSEVMDAVRGPLTAQGFAILQTVTEADSVAFGLTTTLLHTSGEWLAGTVRMPMPDTAQQVGGALTYARRYGLAALCGVVADDDDDGETATAPSRAAAKPAAKPATPTPSAQAPSAPAKSAPKAADAPVPDPECPACGGAMWDNRTTKKNPRAPDFKCKDKGCEGVYWPGEWPPKPVAAPAGLDQMPAALAEGGDDGDLF